MGCFRIETDNAPCFKVEVISGLPCFQVSTSFGHCTDEFFCASCHDGYSDGWIYAETTFNDPDLGYVSVDENGYDHRYETAGNDEYVECFKIGVNDFLSTVPFEEEEVVIEDIEETFSDRNGYPDSVLYFNDGLVAFIYMSGSQRFGDETLYTNQIIRHPVSAYRGKITEVFEADSAMYLSGNATEGIEAINGSLLSYGGNIIYREHTYNKTPDVRGIALVIDPRFIEVNGSRTDLGHLQTTNAQLYDGSLITSWSAGTDHLDDIDVPLKYYYSEYGLRIPSGTTVEELNTGGASGDCVRTSQFLRTNGQFQALYSCFGNEYPDDPEASFYMDINTQHFTQKRADLDGGSDAPAYIICLHAYTEEVTVDFVLAKFGNWICHRHGITNIETATSVMFDDGTLTFMKEAFAEPTIGESQIIFPNAYFDPTYSYGQPFSYDGNYILTPNGYLVDLAKEEVQSVGGLTCLTGKGQIIKILTTGNTFPYTIEVKKCSSFF